MSDLLEVGRIGRAHGIKGDVLVHLTTDRIERVAVGSRLLARGAWLVVAASSRSGDRWRVLASDLVVMATPPESRRRFEE